MSKLSDFIAQRLVNFLPNELTTQELSQLLSPRQHPMLLSQRRSMMIVNRVRFFAMLFTLLTPLWGVIDIIVFEPSVWIKLALLRLVTTAAFAALSIYYRSNGSLFDAYRAITLLFLIPTLFYIASHSLLSGYDLSNLSAAVASGYAFLPFLLMAGLAIFPLSLAESILLSSTLLIAQCLAGYLSWSTLNWPSFAGGLWLLILIAGVTMLASASQLAFMITLIRQAIHDPLTGILSRGSGKEIINMQWAGAKRNNQPMALAFIDLDHFKEVNDSFGHEAGDTTLRQFSAALSKNLRDSDSLLRWGGEEFLIVMPSTNLDQALSALQRIQKAGFGSRPDGVPLTASIGLAERIADGLHDSEQLLALADNRMYQAKQAGRNRICAT
ncbi:MAG: GGDEF domain-containing protein [Pseudomonas sp.]|jgi:diguanylate cyclase (GGDEF)-like protein|nr:GGDEF domain-containing protein [Pseudomonas sp.]MDY0415350.1 GGDEF domain-containing protein [Pseudomonas sp.]NLO55314.1 diguanylate cyclase [Gammaproteobacteria bacterium]